MIITLKRNYYGNFYTKKSSWNKQEMNSFKKTTYKTIGTKVASVSQMESGNQMLYWLGSSNICEDKLGEELSFCNNSELKTLYLTCKINKYKFAINLKNGKIDSIIIWRKNGDKC